MRSPRPWALAVLAMAVGCAAEEREGDVDTGDGGTDEALADPVLVATVDLELEVTRHEALEVEAKFVYSGLTQLLIDGRSVGTMTNLGDVGHFESDGEDRSGTLRLRLDGGMVPGDHVLQLFTPGQAEPLYSNELEVSLVPADPPTLEATLEPTTVDPGDRLLTHGDLLLLVSLRVGSEPTLVILRSRDGHWDDEGAFSLPIPGYASAGSEVDTDVSATILEHGASAGGVDRLRAAWRVGDPGERIDFVDVEWAEAGATATDVAPALTLEDEIVGTVEWATLGRPMLLGDNLVAELYAPRDTESPAPGDHRLATVRFVGTPPAPTAPDVVELMDVAVDADAIGPALDLAALDVGEPRSFSVRIDDLRPGVVDFGVLPSLRTQSVQGPIPSLAATSTPLVTTIGAFGSHVVGALAGGTIRVLELDMSGSGGAIDASPAAAALPTEPPTAAPTAGVIAGASVLLVPYGPAAPVHAVICSRLTATVQVLDGLQCDSVALAQSLDGNREGALELACLWETALFLGELRVAP